MRIWVDKDGSMLTDEQLLRHITAFGSLSAACKRGDIRLLSQSGERKGHSRPTATPANRKGNPRLSDYLEAGRS